MMKIVWHFKEFKDLTAEELYKVLRLRSEVFVVEQNCVYNDLDGKDTVSSHLWAESDGITLATCRILPPGVSYDEVSIGRIVSHPDYRHLKLGHQMMAYALEIIRNHYNTEKVRISAQVYLRKFYEQYGFVQVGEDYLEDDIPHMEMLRQ